MPILATCQCGRQYQMKEEFAGKRAKCPECGRMVQVPALPPGAEPTPPAAAPPEGMSGRKMLLIAGGVNLGALIGLIFFIVYLNMGEPPTPYREMPGRSPTPAGEAPAPEAKPGQVTPAPAAPATAKAPPAAPVPQPGTVAPPAPPKPPAEPGPGPAVAVKSPPAPVTPAAPVTPTPAAPVTPTPAAPAPTPPGPDTPAPVAVPPPTPPAPTPAAPVAVPATPAPATPAGDGQVAVLKEDANGGTMRMPVGQQLRIELPPKFEPANFVTAKLIDEEGTVQDLGQDKEAEKRGVYAFSYKGVQVGTASLTVMFTDTDPAGKQSAHKWRFDLTIKVRRDAPPGGRFSPPYTSKRPATPSARE